LGKSYLFSNLFLTVKINYGVIMKETPYSRRDFIKTVSGGVIGGVALYSMPQDSLARYIISRDEKISPKDEQFWKFVRGQFPLLQDRVYLNNGTMGPSPYVVLDSVRSEMERIDATGDYGGWDVARGKIAKFINAGEDEISITHNVTEGINVIAGGLLLKRGDEVIMTTHEHAGNALPWLARARRDGIVLKTFVPGWTAAETLDRINSLITKKTRAIAVPHVTCTIGQVLPGKEISKLGRDKGLWVMLDGAHTPGMMPLDVKDIGCDFFATCGHKWMMGPKGTGFLYVRKEVQDVVEPIWVGGGSDAGWDMTKKPPELKGYASNAHRYDFATQNAAIYIGMGSAIDFLYHIGMENIAARDRAMSSHIREELVKLGDKIEMLTPEEEKSRASVTGFRIANYQYDKFVNYAWEKHKIRLRAVGEGGLNSIRVSTHIYNNFDEVELFLKAVKEVA
jgi:selenocysteine lyase/cysteine desulfurase